jgi:hypothetical protein
MPGVLLETAIRIAYRIITSVLKVLLLACGGIPIRQNGDAAATQTTHDVYVGRYQASNPAHDPCTSTVPVISCSRSIHAYGKTDSFS